MGRLVYHRKKDSGTTYVYEVVEEHWDKQLKQMRSKQACIGKLDPVTGELIESKRDQEHIVMCSDGLNVSCRIYADSGQDPKDTPPGFCWERWSR